MGSPRKGEQYSERLENSVQNVMLIRYHSWQLCVIRGNSGQVQLSKSGGFNDRCGT